MAAQFESNRSVIVLSSVTSKGRSRIVPMLERGPVTIPRSLVQFVATEWGVADLRSATVKERAMALAAIAHADHRGAAARRLRSLR